jgi:DnaD/phage-associated family protein
MQKSYYAIIPANVRYDKELINGAKLLYGEITALCNEKGYCWASNSYFSELYGVSKVTISKWINQLVEKGYLYSEIHYKEGSKEILNRYLKIVNDPIKEKLNTPIKEKFKENNTDINNTFNNSTTTTETLNPVVHFENLLCRLSPRQAENLYQWVDDFNGQTDIIIEAINIADDKNKRTYAFVEYLLREWANNRLDSLDRVRAYEQEKFNRQRLPKQYTNQKRSLFEQGEESKKRQAAIKPMTPEEEEAMRRMEEELPF